jgi:hypothetical protein
MPETLEKPTVSVTVYNTKLVKSPIVNYPSMVNYPPTYKIDKIKKLPNKVMVNNIIA